MKYKHSRSVCFMDMISHSQTDGNGGNKEEGKLQDQKLFDFQ